MGWRALGLSVFVGGFLSAASAGAQQPVDAGTRAAARTLGSAGVAAYQAKDFKIAGDKLERAYQVLQVPSLGLWSARALAKTGKLVEAAQRYVEVTRLSVSNGDPQVQKQAAVDAQKELTELTPRIPSIIVKLNGVTASALNITIDDIQVSAALVGESRPVNPGPHHVVAATDAEKAEADVSVVEGEQKVVSLEFKGTLAAVAPTSAATPGAPAQPPPDTNTSKSGLSRALGWTAVGVGGAGIVLGAVTGVIVLGKKSSIESRSACSGSSCLTSESNDVNSYNSLRTVSSVAFVAGGVLAGTGLVLLLTAPKSAESALAHPTPRAGSESLALHLGLGSAVLGGSF